jgi:hypothetical protein
VADQIFKLIHFWQRKCEFSNTFTTYVNDEWSSHLKLRCNCFQRKLCSSKWTDKQVVRVPESHHYFELNNSLLRPSCVDLSLDHIARSDSTQPVELSWVGSGNVIKALAPTSRLVTTEAENSEENVTWKWLWGADKTAISKAFEWIERRL